MKLRIIKKRQDLKLINTKLLLYNYNNMYEVSKGVKLKDIKKKSTNAFDILRELNSIDDKKTYIDRLLNEPVHAALVVMYIDEVLKLFKALCSRSNNEDKYLFRLIELVYFSRYKTKTEIINRYKMDRNEFYAYLKKAHIKLSNMIFGLDDFRLY